MIIDVNNIGTIKTGKKVNEGIAIIETLSEETKQMLKKLGEQGDKNPPKEEEAKPEVITPSVNEEKNPQI